MRRIIAGLCLVVSTPAAAQLDRWEGVATPIDNAGRGEDFYRLEARASWPGEAVVKPPISLRIELPDGTLRAQPMARGEGPGSRRITVLVPSAAVRDLQPARVRARVSLIDGDGRLLGKALLADIAQFPTPETDTPPPDLGPFGWGRPLPEGPALLPRRAPDGSIYARMPGKTLFAATAEATVAQVASRLPGYDPRAGRSDEFNLEGSDQPAVGLTFEKANAYVKAIARADRSGLAYRLPTAAEWLSIARAGRPSAFWWGDAPTYPAGANFLGPEPSLAVDATAPADGPGFEANPLGLRHTFGNVEEWAVDADGRPIRLGGHFRTEPASPLPPGTDARPFVGVRPVFDLDAARGTAAAKLVLRAPGLEGVRATFDPSTAAVRLTGVVAEPSLRRLADARIASLWYIAAVADDLSTPPVPEGRLATLGAVVARRDETSFGRPQARTTLAVRWGPTLPVEGSNWWANLYQDGRHVAHRLIERRPTPGGRVTLVADRAAIDPRRPFAASLSLGGPAPQLDDPRVVSNVAEVRP